MSSVRTAIRATAAVTNVCCRDRISPYSSGDFLAHVPGTIQTKRNGRSLIKTKRSKEGGHLPACDPHHATYPRTRLLKSRHTAVFVVPLAAPCTLSAIEHGACRRIRPGRSASICQPQSFRAPTRSSNNGKCSFDVLCGHCWRAGGIDDGEQERGGIDTEICGGSI